ncbi:MAG: RES family NAD+ phosphorylase [Holophaga sp.]|nr:RES family NAD+ phosphorylase [Holophaga sp.]
MNHVQFLNHPWHQLKFLSVSPLAQVVPPDDRPELAGLLARAGVFHSWPPGAGNADRLPHLRAYLRMPGRGPMSRFCDGSFRAVYAGKTLATCRAEVAHHHGQALRDSGEPPGAARIFEALLVRVGGAFLDVRQGHRELHRPEDYGPAQAFGRAAKAAGETGIVFRSLRWKPGECLAILDGEKVRSCALAGLVALRWDGEQLA